MRRKKNVKYKADNWHIMVMVGIAIVAVAFLKVILRFICN